MKKAASVACAVFVLSGMACNASDSPQFILRFTGRTWKCSKDQNPSLMATACNEEAVLKYVWPAIEHAKAGGRIYYNAACVRTGEYELPFPATDGHEPPKGLSPPVALRTAFQSDKNVTLTEDPGIIRFRIGNPPDALLSTKISALKMDPYAQYNPEDAIGAILENKDVSAAWAKLGLASPPGLSDHIIQPPDETLPHLPMSMQNLSMDQALDAVAKTFGVVVIYAAEGCQGGHLADVDFAYPPSPDDVMSVPVRDVK